MTDTEERDLERERRELEIELLRAQVRVQNDQHVNLLWQRPMIANCDMPEALGISGTTWKGMKAHGLAPAPVKIGGRMFYRAADVSAWLESLQPGRQAAAADDDDSSEEPDEPKPPPGNTPAIPEFRSRPQHPAARHRLR